MSRLSPVPHASIAPAAELAVQQEMIAIVRTLAQTLGMPRSLGEIYGYLYASPEPRSMDEVRDALGLSLGSVSQGVRQLKSFKAVRGVEKVGERKEYLVAETELRRFVSGFLRESLLPEIEASARRLDALEPILQSPDCVNAEHYRHRFGKMRQWHQTARRWLRPLTLFVK